VAKVLVEILLMLNSTTVNKYFVLMSHETRSEIFKLNNSLATKLLSLNNFH